MKTLSNSNEVVLALSCEELSIVKAALASAIVRYSEPGFEIAGIPGSFFAERVRSICDELFSL